MFKGFGKDVIDLVKNFGTLNTITELGNHKLQKYISTLNLYKDNGSISTDNLSNILEQVDSLNSDNLTNLFKQIAEGSANARINIEDCYAAILDGNTHGLKNVQSIFNTYNNTLKNSEKDQKAFTKAVGQTNTNLSNYLSTVKTDGTASLTGYMGYLAKTTAKTIGLQAATLALNTALTMGLSIGLSLLAKAVNDAINAEQEAIDKAREQANQLDEDQKSIQEYIVQVNKLRAEREQENISTERSIEIRNELYDIQKTLIEQYGIESDRINLITGDINEQIKAMRDLNKEKYFEAKRLSNGGYNAAVNKFRNQKAELDQRSGLFYDSFGNLTSIYGLDSIFESAGFTKSSTSASRYFEGDIYAIDKALSEVQAKLEEKAKDNTVNDYLKSKYTEVYNYISSVRTDWSNKIIAENEDIYAQWLKNESDYSNDYWDIIRERTKVEQAIESENTEEIFKAKEDFNNKLKEIINNANSNGDTDVANYLSKSFGNFTDTLTVTGITVQNTTESIYVLKKATEDLQKTLDTTFSNQSIIQSAFDKIQEGSYLSADEVRKLIELCPELATEFVKTADGYTIGADKLINANDEIVKSTKQSLQERANYLREFINNDYDTSTINGEASAKAHNEWKQSVEKAKTELEGLELILSMFGLTTEDTVDKVKELSDKYNELSDSTSKLVGKAKTLSSAFAEQNENGSLSTETVLSLIENGYAAALMYDKTTGAIRLNADAYIALATAEIEAQIADLETQKAIADTSAIEAKKSIVSNLGWSYLGAAQSALELARAESIINNAEADVSNYDAKIKALEEYKNHLNDITNGTYGGSGGSSNTDPNKEAFDAENDLRKHWLAMGKDKTGKKYTEEMYYAWLDSADGYKKYFSDLTKYTDEYRQYEEEIYKWRINKDKELFEERIENYEKLKDKELNDSEYDNPIKKYEEAGKIINQEMSAIQNRIQELVESGSSAVQDEIDSLKEKYDSLKEEQEEIQKDIWDTRVENEKTFWEQQKEAVETYYDNEIKNLEKIEDEQERINKKEELRLNLIKAQQELLDAKKNRNQLLFANGGFYYDYDQEAVQKAQENITNAEKDITDFNNDETKRLLEEQRDNEIAYYNTIIEMLEAYINKTLPIETSDSEVFNTAMSSKYAQSVLNKQTEITPVTLESFLQDRFPNYNKQALASGYDLLGKIMNKPVSSTLNAWDNLKKMNAQDYTVNNNNNSVYIENMPITVPVGTTEEQVQAMIDQFASGVISTVRAKRAKLQ